MGAESIELTPAQCLAAEYAGGPLVVLAGPGTGKTRTIVHRIAHQIRERGIEPERIVALTFTVKAAGQLRERLAEVVGAVQAERINAHTIHAFGHRLVRRFGDLIGVPAEFELIDDAQEARLLKRIVLENGLFTESRAEGLSAIAADLKEAFHCLGNLGISPGTCMRHAEKWANRPVRGDGLFDALERDADAARQLRFADTALAYDLYMQERLRRGWVCFEDFVTLPIRLLATNKHASDMVRDDYRAFIVDEFQDCNPGQIELLRLLAPPAGQPDLCVVGDDDQAIYRFRGADEQAFQRFAKIWPKHEVLELKENYRSQPELTRVANTIISHAQVRFRPEKVIEFPRGKKATGACIEAIKLEHDFDDADVIASMILTERAQRPAGGPSPKTAVIARNHGDLDRVAAALRVEGISFDRVREKDQFEDAGVDDVLAWVEWLIDPGATWAARRVLTRPPYGLPPDVVTQWEQQFIAHKSQAAAGRERKGLPARFSEFVRQRAHSEWPAGTNVAAKYDALAAEVATRRADEAVYHIVLSTDAAHAELLPGRERARRIAALISFIGLAREKQARLEGAGDLREFWSYLNELRGQGGKLPQPQTLADALDSDEPTVGEGAAAEGRVQLLTAHSAKGLEFDTVYVTRVTPQYGFPSRKSEEPWEPPEGLAEVLDTRKEAERRADEERRLFYVACTRAERRLVLLAKWNRNPSSTTHFFEELVRPTPPKYIALRSGADVLKEASDLGVGGAARSAIELSGRDDESAELLKAATERVRRQSRLEAALALEAVERGDLAVEHLVAVNERLKAAAAQMAAAAQVEKSGAVAPWLVKTHPDLAALARRLESTAKADKAEQGRSAASILISPMEAPLSLSFTAVDQYLRCPRCFYINNVLKLPQPERRETTVGIVAHEVLKDFFDQWAAAEADGQPKPGLDRLLAMARERYISKLHDKEKVSEEVLDQLAAQMKLLFERLHGGGSASPHILETERKHDFEYELDGKTHLFTAKIDRIDQLQDGGIRIIDYKTGNASKAKTEPKKDDLQLGIYALALKLSKGQSWAEGGLKGVAEYWVLATGERGVIDLADLDETKIRSKIDKAARGMLEGRFDAKSECDGPCRLFVD
jgi:DNA helicase-2/ATP-dependent DNA helicase PcrA